MDANRGQGDVRTYLRLGGSALPTIWAAAASGDPARAVLTPGEVNAARHRRLQELRFGLVMAPHGDQVDPSTVTPAVYRSVLAAAQDVADLVVVDTQIVEDGADTTGLIDGLLVPALRDGGWALAVADTSSAGLTNTLQRARTVHAAGIPPDRLMSALSFCLAPEPVVASLNWLSITGLSALYDDAWVAVWFMRRLYSRPNQWAHCHIWWIRMPC